MFDKETENFKSLIRNLKFIEWVIRNFPYIYKDRIPSQDFVDFYNLFSLTVNYIFE
jgi:hypothetical protein